ncbi:MAG: hypothetical protein ABSG86_17260 [Thermoguttaceae bacterium]
MLDAHGRLFFREYRTPAFALTLRRGVAAHLEAAGRECEVSRKRAADLNARTQVTVQPARA